MISIELISLIVMDWDFPGPTTNPPTLVTLTSRAAVSPKTIAEQIASFTAFG